ncbi:MAG: aspartate kinase [Cyclobacteriaceae bacterium]
MKVFKFGGAALRDSEGFKRVADIILSSGEDRPVVVVSAAGKTTDALEKVFKSVLSGIPDEVLLSEILRYHYVIASELLSDPEPFLREMDAVFKIIREAVAFEGGPDALYDLIVSKGEVLSSLLMFMHLSARVPDCSLLDACNLIITDGHHREANVNWPATESRIRAAAEIASGIKITQGFTGSTVTGKVTTLGRDGSDFSAAIFATVLEAQALTIWKDVPGVMSADPKRVSGAVVFAELPYREAAEMTYYGASVIHPKTIKPLANKKIPLFVKSFSDPSLPGTIIHECRVEKLPPLIVFKDHQCLISCKGTDYTFITEHQLSDIFSYISASGVRINVMQNSAITFSFCVDYREGKMQQLIERLSRNFEVFYNTGLTLITVKNYSREVFNEYRSKPGILMEQSSRTTLQILVRP